MLITVACNEWVWSHWVRVRLIWPYRYQIASYGPAITIDPGKSSRLLSLNQQSYKDGAQFIARTVDGDYLQAAAL